MTIKLPPWLIHHANTSFSAWLLHSCVCVCRCWTPHFLPGSHTLPEEFYNTGGTLQVKKAALMETISSHWWGDRSKRRSSGWSLIRPTAKLLFLYLYKTTLFSKSVWILPVFLRWTCSFGRNCPFWSVRGSKLCWLKPLNKNNEAQPASFSSGLMRSCYHHRSAWLCFYSCWNQLTKTDGCQFTQMSAGKPANKDFWLEFIQKQLAPISFSLPPLKQYQRKGIFKW